MVPPIPAPQEQQRGGGLSAAVLDALVYRLQRLCEACEEVRSEQRSCMGVIDVGVFVSDAVTGWLTD